MMKSRNLAAMFSPLLGIFMLCLLLCAAPAQVFGQTYSTPNTGVNWTLDDLVTNSGGVVTGSAPNYAITDTFAISANDTLTIAPGAAITMTVTQSGKNGESDIGIEIFGRLEVHGTNDLPVVFTATPAVPGQWDGIIVMEQGSVNMSYAKILYADDAAVLFDEVSRYARGSVIDHCLVDYCNDDGIDLETYDAPTFVLSNSVIQNSWENGLEMEFIGRTAVTLSGNFFYDNGSAGLYFNEGGRDMVITGNVVIDHGDYGIEVDRGAQGLQIQNNFIYGNNEGIGFNTDDESGGENALIDGNVIANNNFAGIWAYYSTGHTITNNAIGGNSQGVYMQNSWNSLIAGNSIGETTLDGSLFDINNLDLPFGYNAQAANAIEGNPSSMTLEGNNNQGILVHDGIPGLGAEPTAYGWIEVNRNNADDWDEKDDDVVMDEAAIGFDFPVSYTTALTGTVYTHFQMQSNGALELATGPGQTDDITYYHGRGEFAEDSSDRTFLFSNTDDWDDITITGTEPLETHNAVQVKMNGWGYRYFNTGDLDGDGNEVTEECLVFRWYMQAEEDADFYDPPAWNDFQAIIYPDGRIRWNTRLLNGRFLKFGCYSGLYAGANGLPFEIQATWEMAAKSSYLYDPRLARETTTQIAANTIVRNNNQAPPRKNGVAYGGVALEYSGYHIIRGNVISGNSPGIMPYGDDTLNTLICYNDIFNNAAFDRKLPDMANIYNDSGNPVNAENNFWDTDSPADYVWGGEVDVDPWLPQSIPCPEEAGVLLADSKAISSAGGVITVTGRLYPNTVISIPEMALDAPVTFTVGDVLPLPTMPPGMDGVGIPIAIGPSGTEFNTPIEITIPYAGYNAPNAVFYYNTQTGLWSLTGIAIKSVNKANRTVTISTTHLTTFAAASFRRDVDTLQNIVEHGGDWYNCFVTTAAPAGLHFPFLSLAIAALGGLLLRMRRKR